MTDFDNTIDEATGTTRQQRREAMDERCERHRREMNSLDFSRDSDADVVSMVSHSRQLSAAKKFNDSAAKVLGLADATARQNSPQGDPEVHWSELD